MSGTVPLSVQFTDTSTGSPASWSWDFGDGETSTDENPSHTFMSTGTYSVSLTARNAEGSNTWIGENPITVDTADSTSGSTTVPAASQQASAPYGISVPVASFIDDPPTGSAPLQVQFTDLSSGAPTAWQWDFGDGGSSTE